MSTNTKAVFEKVLELSQEDKLRLIALICDSLDQTKPTFTQGQLDELDRRWAAYEKDPSIAVSWEEARKAIRQAIDARKQKLRDSEDAA